MSYNSVIYNIIYQINIKSYNKQVFTHLLLFLGLSQLIKQKHSNVIHVTDSYRKFKETTLPLLQSIDTGDSFFYQQSQIKLKIYYNMF